MKFGRGGRRIVFNAVLVHHLLALLLCRVKAIHWLCAFAQIKLEWIWGESRRVFLSQSIIQKEKGLLVLFNVVSCWFGLHSLFYGGMLDERVPFPSLVTRACTLLSQIRYPITKLWSHSSGKCWWYGNSACRLLICLFVSSKAREQAIGFVLFLKLFFGGWSSS